MDDSRKTSPSALLNREVRLGCPTAAKGWAKVRGGGLPPKP